MVFRLSPRTLFFSKEERELYFRIVRYFNIHPGNLSLYRTALIHCSSSIKQQNNTLLNNERLEFLGDAILDSIVSEYIFARYPEEDEGFLTNLRSKMVNRDALNEIARKMQIATIVVSNLSPEKGYNYLGNALEAIIGAIFLDKGYPFTKKYVIKHLITKHLNIEDLLHIETNFKSKIIEWSQKNKVELRFEYSETAMTKASDNMFRATIHLGDQLSGSGCGTSKKEAEQKAAEQVFQSLNK